MIDRYVEIDDCGQSHIVLLTDKTKKYDDQIWCKYEDVKELEEKLRNYEEALKFYGDEDNYRCEWADSCYDYKIMEDDGQKAREVLQKYKD